MTKATKIAHQLADGTVVTRKTARTYTHVVVARFNLTERRARYAQPQDLDRQNFETVRRWLESGHANGRALTAEDVARHTAGQHGAKTADEYAALMAQARVERVNQDHGTGERSAWFVCAWCGRLDLAEKEARRVTGYNYADIRVEAINHGAREV